MLAAELLEAGQSFVEDVQSRAIADADAFVVTERDARDRRHLVAGKQLVAEVHRLQASVAGVDEEVERTLWLEDPDVRDRLQTAEDELAANVVFTTQVFDEALVAFQCRNRAVLGEGAGIGNRVVLNLVDRLGKVLRSGG